MPDAAAGEHPVPISVPAVMAVAKQALDAQGANATLDRAARDALHRAANIFPLFLATIAEEHGAHERQHQQRSHPKRAAPRMVTVGAPEVAAAFADTGIAVGRQHGTPAAASA